jgi:predicted PurR-regulated permease PerM
MEPTTPSKRVSEPEQGKESRPSLIDALAGGSAVKPEKAAGVGLVLLGFGTFLYVGRVVLIPLTLALMLSFIFNPLVRGLHRIRVPKALASALVVLGLGGALGLATVRLIEPASEWAARLPRTLLSIEHKVRPLKRPVDEANRIAERVERIAGVGGRAGVREVRLQEEGLATSMLGTLLEVAVQAGVVVFALYFLLIWGDSLLERSICLLPDLGDQMRANGIIRHIEGRMSLYLGTVTLVYACLGTAVGISVHLLGLRNPVLWGVLAFVLHYIPYVGSAVGIAIVALASLATFASTTDALMPPLAYLALSAVEGNVISPIILGRTFALSPLVIFVWLVLWSWLWGIAGAIVAVPLLMLLKITCEQSPALSPIAAFLRR